MYLRNRNKKKSITRYCHFFIATSLLGVTIQPIMPLAQINSDQLAVYLDGENVSQFDSKADFLQDEKLLEAIQAALEGVTDQWQANSVETIRKEIKRQELAGFKAYVVQWGDNLSNIAEAADVKLDDLLKVNHLKKSDSLMTGDILLGVLSEGQYNQSSASQAGVSQPIIVPTTTVAKAEETTKVEELTTTVAKAEETTKVEEPTTTVAKAEEPTKVEEPTTTVAKAEETTKAEEPTTTVAKEEEPTKTEEPTTTVAKAEETTKVEEPTTTVAKAEETTKVEEPTTTVAKAEETTKVEEPTTTVAKEEETTKAEEPTTTVAKAEETTKAEEPTTTVAKAEETTKVEEPTTTVAKAEETTKVEEPTTTVAKEEETTKAEEPTTTVAKAEETTKAEEPTTTVAVNVFDLYKPASRRYNNETLPQVFATKAEMMEYAQKNNINGYSFTYEANQDGTNPTNYQITVKKYENFNDTEVAQIQNLIKQGIFEATNKLREKNKIATIERSDVLDQMAQERADQLHSLGKLDAHAGFKEKAETYRQSNPEVFDSTSLNRGKAIGENQSKTMYSDSLTLYQIAENIVNGYYLDFNYGDGTRGHRQNMLDPNHGEGGFGVRLLQNENGTYVLTNENYLESENKTTDPAIIAEYDKENYLPAAKPTDSYEAFLEGSKGAYINGKEFTSEEIAKEKEQVAKEATIIDGQ